MSLLRIIFLFACCLFLSDVYCQNDVLYHSIKGADTPVVKEKIYAHTDKNLYVAGELLWFKLYVVNADNNRLFDLSKVAYAELIDSLNKPVAQAKIRLVHGLGDGSFSLSPTVSSGSYTFRAYTNWMKNDGTDDFFEKNIAIINVQKLTVNNKEKESEQMKIQFFPEGGNLVYGLQNHVACRANNNAKKEAAFTGWLLDNGDTSLSFHSDLYSIAGFDFIPLPNHTYKAVIQPQNSTSFFTQNLPDIQEKGYAMNVVDNNDSNLTITVSSAQQTAGQVYLLIHKNEKTAIAKENGLINGKTSFSIKKSSLPNGASYLTVFNSEKQPVCERLYYKKGFRTVKLTVASDEAVYDVRKKVTLTVGADDIRNDHDSAFLSMAVYRLDSLQSLDENRIEDYLFLSSELKSNIEHAGYYLSNEEALNNLLLTVSSNHFTDETKKQNSKPLFAFAPEYNGHIITGNITAGKTEQPLQNTTAYLSVEGKGTQFYPGVSDDNGTIRWETKDFYGASKLVAQSGEGEDSNYTIHLDDPFSHQYSSWSVPSFLLPQNCPNTLAEHSISMQVPHIYSETKLEQLKIPQTDTSAFYDKADKTYRLDDFTRFNTLEEILREYVILANVTKRKGDFHLPVFDNATKLMFDTDPLVLLDGVPFFNLNHFMSLDPQPLQKLDVVNRKFFYGAAVFDGVLNWQSYNGDYAETNLDPHALVVDYDGLALHRQFYSPSYESDAQMNSHVPDFRNLLYWNPNIVVKEKQELSFYTSDLPGSYVVVVQGITAKGEAGSATTVFDVKK